MTTPILPLTNMDKRHSGLTWEIAACYLQAARVCLNRHYASPQDFLIQNDNKHQIVKAKWKAPDKRTICAWANTDDATRDGAYACALAATELVMGLVAVSRAETRTGADYYVGPIGHGYDDLENCYRLEVSGTDGEKNEVKRRLIRKINQTLRGNSNLPAIAAVVGFRSLLIAIKTVEDKT